MRTQSFKQFASLMLLPIALASNAVFALQPAQASSAPRFCNHTDYKIKVAYARSVENDRDHFSQKEYTKKFRVSGWTYLNPSECDSPHDYEKPFNYSSHFYNYNEYYYVRYYDHHNNQWKEWKNWDGDYKFCVDYDPFKSYQWLKKGYKLDCDRGYKIKEFKPLDSSSAETTVDFR